MVRELPERYAPIEKRARPRTKYRFLPWASEKRPKMGMNAAVMMREVRGTQSTTLIGAFRLIDIVGSMSDIIPVSSGGTKLPRLTAARENHLRLLASASKSQTESGALYDRSESTRASAVQG